MLGLNVPYSHRQELIQLDNSFGLTAAIAEMLLQSHAGEIHLLPALPRAWAKSGSFRGLCARGNFTVDCAWKDARITTAIIHGPPGASATVRIADKVKQVTLPSEGVLKLTPAVAVR